MLASSASSVISAETQTGVRSVSPEKKEWIRKESEAILAKNMMLREKTKEILYEKRMKHEKLIQDNREHRLQRWIQKTKNSPFAINLVAEDERILEETTIRTTEERERRSLIETRKDRAKNEIILKALSEFSDLEALRKEKRAILDEEQRLRALLSLEKVNHILINIISCWFSNSYSRSLKIAKQIASLQNVLNDNEKMPN